MNISNALSFLLGLSTSFKNLDIHLDKQVNGFRIFIQNQLNVDYVRFDVNLQRINKFQLLNKNYTVTVYDSEYGIWVAEFPLKLYSDDIITIWSTLRKNNDSYEEQNGPRFVSSFNPLGSRHQEEHSCYHRDNNGNCDSSNLQSRSWRKPTQHRIAQNIPPIMVTKQCEPTETEVSNRRVCKGELIFDDNFDTLNTSKWRHELRLPLDTGDAEFTLYAGEVEVKNGHLQIKPMQWSSYKPNTDIRYGSLDLGSRCTGKHDLHAECQMVTSGQRILPPVVAPRINTRDSFSFMYGRVEIRAKLPQGDWLNPLLLLEPFTEYYGQTGYESGQLRVAYTHGNKHFNISNVRNILYGGAILSLDANNRNEFMANTRRNSHFGDEFHIYSLTWTSEHLELKVDNQTYGFITGNFSGSSSNDELFLNSWRRGGYMAPFDQPFFLTLGLSVGGFGDYPDNICSGMHTKPWINGDPKGQYNFWNHKEEWLSTWHNPELLVDYVRVYAL